MNKSALAQTLSSSHPSSESAHRSAYLKMQNRSVPALRSLAWQKHDVMRALYSLAGGREHAAIDLDDLMNSIELQPGRVYNTLDRLEQEGWIRSFNGSCVELLSAGIAAVERGTTKPYKMIELDTNLKNSAPKPGLAAGSGR